MPLKLIHLVSEMSAWRASAPPAAVIGLVPTMGALHAGHESLIRLARGECSGVVVSIFVNPLQFGPREDFGAYPRPLETDLEGCRRLGVDAVFNPPTSEMYPAAQETFVEVEGMSDRLCGKFRPGHFRGVTTVVLKLLNIVTPHRAYFGEKDAQQLALIRRMVRDLNVAVDIVPVPTVREESGLARSSRNEYLTPGQRETAAVIYRALQAALGEAAAGVSDSSRLRAAALKVLEQEPQVEVEYLEVVDAEEMNPVEAVTGPVRIAAAIRIGGARLIDNVLWPGPGGGR